ncbi:MAG: hypothetical protein K2X86_00315 [Cytophagaceae bacterium]|nr:hypothetical protein [Cytophagaceae bacterium]
MRQKLSTLALLIFSLIISIENVKGSHLVGADITYTCTGANTYRFTLSLYRECASGALLEPIYTINYSSVSCNQQGSFEVFPISGTGGEISPVCPTVQSQCTGGASPGVQKFVYEGTVTLPQQCTDWIFGFRECNRNFGINTIVAPGQKCLYVEARMNNVLAPCNSSPTFSNDPVAFICAGQDVKVNAGAIDPNNDLLRFSTVTPKISKDSNVVYILIRA